MAGGSSDDIRAHIESIAARSDADLALLANRLSGGSWPGGASDRTEPGAIAWLQRWRPSGPAPATPLCGCAGGHCQVCN
jgi:hypothetical protein